MKILIGDDHPVVVNGLLEFLEKIPFCKVVGTANNGRAVCEQYKLLNPDVTIMDISMREMNGIDAARKIIEFDKSAKVVFYSINLNRSEIYSCYKLGGKGYVSKEEPLENLLDAIQWISNDKIYFGDFFSEENYTRYEEKCDQINNGKRNLSFREKDILFYVAQGFSNTDIAEVLNISVKTIEDHRRNIRKKKNLVGAAEFIKFAIEFANNEIET